jgi:hypothetical protein
MDSEFVGELLDRPAEPAVRLQLVVHVHLAFWLGGRACDGTEDPWPGGPCRRTAPRVAPSLVTPGPFALSSGWRRSWWLCMTPRQGGRRRGRRRGSSGRPGATSRAPGVADPDADAPSGHDQGAATEHPPLDADRLGSAAGTVAGPAGRASRIRAISAAVSGLGRLHSRTPSAASCRDAAVDSDGDPLAGEPDPDGCWRPARATSPQALTSRSTSTGPPGITGPPITGGGARLLARADVHRPRHPAGSHRRYERQHPGPRARPLRPPAGRRGT